MQDVAWMKERDCLVKPEGTTEEQQGRKLLGRDGDSLSSEGRRGKTQVMGRDATRRLPPADLESLEAAGHCSAAAKTLVGYQRCFSHQTKTQRQSINSFHDAHQNLTEHGHRPGLLRHSAPLCLPLVHGTVILKIRAASKFSADDKDFYTKHLEPEISWLPTNQIFPVDLLPSPINNAKFWAGGDL